MRHLNKCVLQVTHIVTFAIHQISSSYIQSPLRQGWIYRSSSINFLPANSIAIELMSTGRVVIANGIDTHNFHLCHSASSWLFYLNNHNYVLSNQCRFRLLVRRTDLIPSFHWINDTQQLIGFPLLISSRIPPLMASRLFAHSARLLRCRPDTYFYWRYSICTYASPWEFPSFLTILTDPWKPHYGSIPP